MHSEILKVADQAYPDDYVSIVDASKGIDVGDTLATFIGQELQDVARHYDSTDQATHFCIESMNTAISQLEKVRDALVDYQEEII